MKKEYGIGIITLLLVGLGLITLFISPTKMDFSKRNTAGGMPYVEIVNPSGFVNTGDKPIRIADYVGKNVIVLDIMTYSCINCQRTFPYLVAWYEKYKDEGLIVIGIHTPEFAFEKDKENVEEAMERFGITFPVVLDNDYSTWNALGNRFWPHKYLIDIHGNVVYDHVGEGEYEEIEMKIRELLAERAETLGESVSSPSNDPLAVDMIPKTAIEARSPETYFGSKRNEYLANGAAGLSGERHFELPNTFNKNNLYLGGTWNITEEYAASVSDARIVFRYSAGSVYFVADADTPIEIEVWQDGKLIGDARGADVNESGVTTVEESRLYEIIHNEASGEHILELRIKGAGLRAYTFTFG